MQKLNGKHSPALTQRALRYLEIQLKAQPDTMALEPPLRAHRDSLAQRQDALEALQEERLGMSARIAHLDGEVDALVSQISRHALALTAGDRNDVHFTRLFPKNPTELTRPLGGDEQRASVKNLLLSLEADAPTYGAELQALGARLSQVQDTPDTAESRRKDLYLSEARARAALDEAVDEAQRAYNRTYHALAQLRDDRAWVESFFRPLRSSPPRDEEDEG